MSYQRKPIIEDYTSYYIVIDGDGDLLLGTLAEQEEHAIQNVEHDDVGVGMPWETLAADGHKVVEVAVIPTDQLAALQAAAQPALRVRYSGSIQGRLFDD